MAYTHRSGFPVSNELANPAPIDGDSVTQAITTGEVGDIVLAYGHNGVFLPGYKSIYYAASVADSAGAITWQSSAAIRGQDRHDLSISEGQSIEIWYGVVSTAGAQTTVSMTFSGPATDMFLYLDEWGSGTGSGAEWAVTTSDFIAFTGSSKTIKMPTLRSGAKGGIYWSVSYNTVQATSESPPDPKTSGFTYWPSTTFGNYIAYDGNLAAETAYTTALQQTYANDQGWYDTIGLIVVDNASVSVNGSGDGMLLVFG